MPMLTVVSPSRWLASCARQSALLGNRPIEVIPNGIDLHRFTPIAPLTARKILNLDSAGKIIVYGSKNALADPNKGFHHLRAALRRLSAVRNVSDIRLLVFGATRPSGFKDPGIPTQFAGYLTDECALALHYAAADVYVAPSIQENLPNSVMEALACGTPVVGFGIGGLPDMVSHGKTGYLASPFDTQDLMQGIRRFLETSSAEAAADRNRARHAVASGFDITAVARRYQTLYNRLMTSMKPSSQI